MKNLFDNLIYSEFFNKGTGGGSTATGGNVSYRSGCRINSSGEQIEYDGYSTSDYISCELNNVVYLLNIYMKSGVENAGNLRIAFYDANKVHLGQTNATGARDNLDGKYEATDGSLSQFTVKSFTDCDLTAVKYFRLCSTELDGDSVVIVTEAGGGSGGGDTGDTQGIDFYDFNALFQPTTITVRTKIVPDGYFRQKAYLVDVKLQGVTDVLGNAFDGCTNLKNISFGDTCNSIGMRAFQTCMSLEHITLPKNIKTIEAYCFSGCGKMTIDNLPSGVEYIKEYGFNACSMLSIDTIPESVKYIHSRAFGGCTNLKEITFEGRVNVFYATAFENCTNLLTINVPWAEGEVANAPWGATNATINYNYVEE